jgi:hypothetical protein
LSAAEDVPVAPEEPSVIAVFSDVTIELIAESAVCICGSTEVTFLVYPSTFAEAASEVTMLAEAEGSSESWLTRNPVEICCRAVDKACWLCCIPYCTSGTMFVTRI